MLGIELPISQVAHGSALDIRQFQLSGRETRLRIFRPAAILLAKATFTRGVEQGWAAASRVSLPAGWAGEGPAMNKGFDIGRQKGRIRGQGSRKGVCGLQILHVFSCGVIALS